MNKEELHETLTQYRIDILKEVDKINKNVSEEIGNLLDQLDKKIKAIEEHESKSKRWKPNQNQLYFTVDIDGQVECVSGYRDEITEWLYLNSNCFKTAEEAEEHQKQIEYTARYKNYVEEHSEPIDWENSKQDKKYYVYFDYYQNEIKVGFSYYYKDPHVIYASSEQIILDAIKEIGEDNFKRYVLEVK